MRKVSEMNKNKSVLKKFLLMLMAVLILAALPGFMQAATAADYEAASQQDLIDALNAGDAVTITTTSDFTGVFNQAKTREEFINLIRG